MSASSAERKFKVAMVGATGAVGETLIGILKERKFPVGEFVALASERSAGGQVDYGNHKVTVQDLATYDFDGVDIAFFSAGGSVSRAHAPRATFKQSAAAAAFEAGDQAADRAECFAQALPRARRCFQKHAPIGEMESDVEQLLIVRQSDAIGTRNSCRAAEAREKIAQVMQCFGLNEAAQGLIDQGNMRFAE